MEFFQYLPDYQIQICKPCGHGVNPSRIIAHLRERHPGYYKLTPRQELQDIVAELTSVPLIDPAKDRIPIPPSDTPHFACLPRHRGFRCAKCRYIVLAESALKSHLSLQHPSGRARGRRARAAVPPEPIPRIEVDCQRFFVSRAGSSFFEVQVTVSVEETAAQEQQERLNNILSKEDFIRLQIKEQLNHADEYLKKSNGTVMSLQSSTQVSPWLEMTLVQSLERVVQAGHTAVCEVMINVFDQARINSFISQRRAFDRPIMVKLQQATWKTYLKVWARLLCFAARTSRHDCPVKLLHRLNASQMTLLDQVLTQAQTLVDFKADGIPQHATQREQREYQDSVAELSDRLDDLCLRLCISLLDHILRGDLFESVVVGFFAAAGVNEDKKILKEAYDYTPTLSAFVKIAQILVIQRSVRAAEDGETEYPGDLLDGMRDRFLLHGTHTPFNWALRLRAYGKKVRNSTISMGFIYWAENQETLFYKGIELHMDDLRKFVRIQIDEAYKELRELMLIHIDEDLEAVVPQFRLRDLKDNLARADSGWNFLRDERNRTVLPTGDKWLIDRIMSHAWLQEEFLAFDGEGNVRWRREAATDYMNADKAFLLRLALIIQMDLGSTSADS
ncbi:hypothetical protein LTR70_007388 [Exophiala xenobiotica]|uniref:C2H2-type domain-containing protein n=1 Tax=Lithohypha guttulata TaxID=1690604 RepID=A0ABR0K4Q0_9EURO|nr:hypothetical protein LTR24_006884 [Lithohypha guttulata]KAK5313966.1 hypothetical protein LTR70_007388 [Exophiala xenobiotica]